MIEAPGALDGALGSRTVQPPRITNHVAKSRRKPIRAARISPLRDPRASAPTLTVRQRVVALMTARPRVSTELLALLAGVFFALVSNRAFWHAMRDTGAFDGPNGAFVALAVFTLLVCVHTGLLYLVLLRATAKVVLTLLLVAGALIGHAAFAEGMYLAPERMQATLLSDLLTPSALGSWEFFWTLVTQAGLPAVLLWRVQVARFSLAIAFVRRVVAFVMVCAFAALAVAIPQDEIRSLMRNHRPLLYLVTPANLMSIVTPDGIEPVQDTPPTHPR